MGSARAPGAEQQPPAGPAQALSRPSHLQPHLRPRPRPRPAGKGAGLNCRPRGARRPAPPPAPAGAFPPAVAKVTVTSRGRRVRNVPPAVAVAGKRRAGAQPGLAPGADAGTRRPGLPCPDPPSWIPRGRGPAPHPRRGSARDRPAGQGPPPSLVHCRCLCVWNSSIGPHLLSHHPASGHRPCPLPVG